MELELSIFNKGELIRACQLVGYKNKNNSLPNKMESDLITMILNKVNPDSNDLRKQYYNTFKLFKIKYNENDTDNELKIKLYKHSLTQLEKALNKMSKKKKEKLTKQLEESIDPTVLDKLKKSGRTTAVVGGGILLIQSGAIVITGANLGICMLLTTGLSSISGILGITFPFAAYTSAAIIGGYIIQAGHFLASPWTATPLLGLSTFLIYRKIRNKKFIHLAGINYLIESKKQLGI